MCTNKFDFGFFEELEEESMEVIELDDLETGNLEDDLDDDYYRRLEEL